MQSVQFTSMYTCISTKSGVWVCFSSSSKQDTLFKSCVAFGINRALMILYCIASWEKCDGASYAINILLWMPYQKIALAVASQLNQQPVEPRPEMFLQLCHHINQPGHEAWLLAASSCWCWYPSCKPDEGSNQIKNYLVLSGTFSDKTNLLICLTQKKIKV